MATTHFATFEDQAVARFAEEFASTVPGTRAAPAKAGNNDAKYGVRIDNGVIFEEDDMYILRIII